MSSNRAKRSGFQCRKGMIDGIVSSSVKNCRNAAGCRALLKLLPNWDVFLDFLQKNLPNFFCSVKCGQHFARFCRFAGAEMPGVNWPNYWPVKKEVRAHIGAPNHVLRYARTAQRVGVVHYHCATPEFLWHLQNFQFEVLCKWLPVSNSSVCIEIFCWSLSKLKLGSLELPNFVINALIYLDTQAWGLTNLLLRLWKTTPIPPRPILSP